MADPTNQSRPVNIPRVNVERVDARNVSVTRMTGTGEAKTAESDLLGEVREALESQTTQQAKDTDRIVHMLGILNKSVGDADVQPVVESLDEVREAISGLTKLIRDAAFIATPGGGGGGRRGGSGGTTTGGGGDDGFDDFKKNLNKFSNIFAELTEKTSKLATTMTAVGETMVAAGHAGSGGKGGHSGEAAKSGPSEFTSGRDEFSQMNRARTIHQVSNISESIYNKFFRKRGNNNSIFTKSVREAVAKGIKDTTNELIHRNRSNILSNFIDTVSKNTANFVNIGGHIQQGVTELVNAVRKNFTIGSGSGTLPMFDLAINEVTSGFSYLTGSSDNLAHTLNGVREAINNGLVSPLLVSGKSLKDYAEETRKAKGEAEKAGVEFWKSMTGTQFTAFQQAQLQSLRSQGANVSSLRDPEVMRQTRREFELLQMIAANTGQTVDELVKNRKEVYRDIDASVAAGSIDADQARGLRRASTIANNSGLTFMDELYKRVAQGGGDFAIQQILAEDAYFEMNRRSNGMLEQLLRGGLNGANSEDLGRMISSLRSNMQDSAASQGLNAAVAAALTQGKQGDFAQIMGSAQLNSGATSGSGILDIFARKIEDFYQNSGIFKSFLESIGANTLATVANTAALLGMGGGLKALFAGLGGLLSRGAGMAGAAAGGLGNLANAGAGALGSTVGRIAGIGLKGVPIVGGVASAGLTAAMGGGMWESILSGVGSVAGGLLGLPFGGVGAVGGSVLGGMGGQQLGRWIDNMNSAPDTGAATLAATMDGIAKQTAQSNSDSVQQQAEMVDLLSKHTSLLERQVELGELALKSGNPPGAPMQSGSYGYGPARSSIGGYADGRP